LRPKSIFGLDGGWAEYPNLAGESPLALFGLLLIPLLLVAAGISIPITFIRSYIVRRNEDRFASEMKGSQRCISWNDSLLESGTLIGEYLSAKGPFRLWWTSEDVLAASPYPCCVDEWPFGGEIDYSAFFGWCRDRFTDPGSGAAVLVYKEGVSERLGSAGNYVSLYSPQRF